MPLIRLADVAKSYGDVEVLPPLNLDFDDGEFTVLVGPSGCGKSTTLRMIAGLESLSGGEIWFGDRPVSTLEPKERDLAMVFQDYALYPHMNVAGNMSFALRLARRPKAEIDAKVQRVAEMLNIAHLLKRKPAQLSGGQRQRVAMGRVLVRDASTLLFDEPLSNLDAKLRARMRTELAGMRDQLDKNMIYVTHDQVEAMTLGDRIVVMNEGLVQQQGSPEELFKKPTNRFVADFIGSPTMNFMDGDLIERDGALFVAGDGFELQVGSELANRAAKRNGSKRTVTAGVRPSDFNRDIVAGSPITVHVVVAEYLGAQSVLDVRCGGAPLLVEFDSARPIQSGCDMTFAVPPDAIHLFDRETGAAF